MQTDFLQLIVQTTGATDAKLIEVIQELWSGYGTIQRYLLTGAKREHVVSKHVCFPDHTSHPRGWNTNLSHQRKLRSYQVETFWYQNWSPKCGAGCRVPECLAVQQQGDETLMIFEDLDESGYSERRDSATPEEIDSCLRWLANFHATFLGCHPEGLWEQGTYWHLDTRPDELEVLDDLPLKNAARQLDKTLRETPFQTFVHGDAKLANFCFSADGKEVAAVDFQYVGGGCGMKDVAYFIGSCLDERDCERQERWLLDTYFQHLNHAINRLRPSIDPSAVEDSWRELFPIAWTDFHRFLKGWSPGHWKLNSYSEKVAQSTLAKLATQ